MLLSAYISRNWCFQTVVLEKTLESPLDSKEKKLVYFQRKSTLNIQSKEWCWSWSANTLATWCEELTHWKKPWFRKDWMQKGAIDNEMVGLLHWLSGHEFEQAPGVSDEEGTLVCCSPWGHIESDTTVWLNWTKLSELTVLLFTRLVPLYTITVECYL